MLEAHHLLEHFLEPVQPLRLAQLFVGEAELDLSGPAEVDDAVDEHGVEAIVSHLPLNLTDLGAWQLSIDHAFEADQLQSQLFHCAWFGQCELLPRLPDSHVLELQPLAAIEHRFKFSSAKVHKEHVGNLEGIELEFFVVLSRSLYDPFEVEVLDEFLVLLLAAYRLCKHYV